MSFMRQKSFAKVLDKYAIKPFPLSSYVTLYKNKNFL